MFIVLYYIYNEFMFNYLCLLNVVICRLVNILIFYDILYM